MITILIIIAVCVTVFGGLLYTDKHRNKQIDAHAKKVVKQVTNRVDQQLIKELEASELGIGVGIEISGLPGYTWSVSRGKARTDNLVVSLKDPKDVAVAKEIVEREFQQEVPRRYNSHGYGSGGYSRTVTRDAKDMEVAVQEVMMTMVLKQVAKIKYEDSMNKIVETYDGKSVTQDVPKIAPKNNPWNGAFNTDIFEGRP